MTFVVGADLASAWLTQPALNPWLVVLIGAISGLLVFAASHALRVLIARHRAVRSARAPTALVTRARETAFFTSIAVLTLLALQMLTARRLLDRQGWLSGDDLFAVTRRQGFVASYAHTGDVVRKGEAILQLHRDAGPDEIAAARNRRDVLKQELEFIQLGALDVDSLVLRDYLLSKSHLQELETRQQKLLETRDVLDRGIPRQQLEDQSQLYQVERNLQSVHYEFEQTATTLDTATKSLELGEKAFADGLIAEEEVDKRRERAAVLRSRHEELRARLSLLERERKRLLALTSKSHTTIGSQLTLRRSELTDLARNIESARANVEEARQRVDDDKRRALQQQAARRRQVQIQIDELDTLIDAPDTPVSIVAPWDGRVGFRDPSPAGMRSESRPLLVLYRPGKVSVRLRVATEEVSVAAGEPLDIKLRALVPEAMNSPFTGELTHKVEVDERTVELQIICDPPAPAVRDVAMGSAVPISVAISRPGILKATGIDWPWALVIAGISGAAVADIRARRRRRRVLTPRGASAGAPSASWLDWGGDPDEFIEFVVGVGVISRRVRDRTPAALPFDADRRPHRPDAVDLRTASHGSDQRILG